MGSGQFAALWQYPSGGGGGALAQNTAAATPARSAAQNTTLLEEIIVTAQKRQQNLDDVPIAISLVSNESLNVQRITDLSDIYLAAPTVAVGKSLTSRETGFSLRGIGSTSFSDGIEPSSGVVLNGVILSRPFVSFAAQFADVERIEILPGPQGTLYGKNASTGLINIVSKKPSTEFEAHFDVMAAGGDEFRTRGYVFGGLTDILSGGLSFAQVTYDGFVENVATVQHAFSQGNIQSVNNDAKTHGQNNLAVSGKLLWEPSDNFSAYFIAQKTDAKLECCERIPGFLDPESGYYKDSILSSELKYLPVNVPLENTKALSDLNVKDATEHTSFIAELTWGLGDYELISITGWRDYNNTIINNSDSSASLQYREDNLQTGTTKQISQELRLHSPLGEKLDYVLGLYYLNVDTKAGNERTRFNSRAPQNNEEKKITGRRCSGVQVPEICRVFSDYDAPIEVDNAAIFGQANYHLTDTVNLILGGRYTRDKLSYSYNRRDPDGFRGGPIDFSDSATETNFSAKLGVQWQPTDDLHTYLTFSQGYKGPGRGIGTTYNPIRPDPANPGDFLGVDVPLEPETNDTYELGVKWNLAGGRALLTASTWFTDLKNLVAAGGGRNNVNIGRVIITNVAGLESKGMEVAFLAQITDALYVQAAYAYVTVEFTDYTTAGCTGASIRRGVLPLARASEAGTGDCREVLLANGDTRTYMIRSGEKLRNTPENSFNLTVKYDIALSNPRFDAFVSSSYAWQDEQRLSTRLTQPSYGLLGLNVGLAGKEGNWKFHVFGENLTDEFFVRSTAAIARGGNSYFINLSRKYQRYFGVSMEVNF